MRSPCVIAHTNVVSIDDVDTLYKFEVSLLAARITIPHSYRNLVLCCLFSSFNRDRGLMHEHAMSAWQSFLNSTVFELNILTDSSILCRLLWHCDWLDMCNLGFITQWFELIFLLFKQIEMHLLYWTQLKVSLIQTIFKRVHDFVLLNDFLALFRILLHECEIRLSNFKMLFVDSIKFVVVCLDHFCELPLLFLRQPFQALYLLVGILGWTFSYFGFQIPVLLIGVFLVDL